MLAHLRWWYFDSLWTKKIDTHILLARTWPGRHRSNREWKDVPEPSMQQERKLRFWFCLGILTPDLLIVERGRAEQCILCTAYLSVPLIVHNWNILKFATQSSLESFITLYLCMPPNGPNISDKAVSTNIALTRQETLMPPLLPFFDENRMGRRRAHTTTCWSTVDPKLIPLWSDWPICCHSWLMDFARHFCIERDGESTLALSFSLFYLNLYQL